MRFLSPEADEAPAVSIVIRARNEAALIGRCLEALVAQDFSGPAEVILVDSGSTDGTVEIARRHAVRIIEIAPAEFTYSSALNKGFAAARAPLVASLSAHVVPIGEGWLGALLGAMRDPEVAGAFSREIPWPDADLYERIRIEAEFPPFRMVKAQRFAWGEEDGERYPLFFRFSNAASVIRRGLWESHPFQELPYAEDLEWSRWAILAGHEIVYEPTARAYHSHREPMRSRAEREVKIQIALAMIFHHRPSLLGTIYRSLRQNVQLARSALRAPISAAQKCYWSLYALWKWTSFSLNWAGAWRRAPWMAR